MANITFDIVWQGKPAQVTFDDDMPHGDFAAILKSTVDLTNVANGQVKIDFNGYVDQVLQKAIRSAPFQPNQDELNKMGKKIHDIISTEVLKHYPLGKSLEPIAMAMLGDTEQMKSLIESMPSAQASSGGTNAKLIVNR